MQDTVLAALGWLIVIWVPGALLADLVRPGAGWLRNMALAPLPALGLTMLVAQLLYVFGFAINGWTVLPWTVAAPVLAWALRKVMRSARHDVQRSPTAGSTEAMLLLTAIAAGLVIWWVSIPSAHSVIPNDDGTHHGLFVSRIVRYATLDHHVVLAGDVASGHPSSAYYPLALHVSAALVVDVTRVPVSVAITVAVVLAAAVLLPLGTYVLARRLAPAIAAVAGTAAILAAMMPRFPYEPIAWGGVPAIVALSMVPIGIDTVCRRQEDGAPVRLGFLLAISAYGLFQLHNSELATVALYGLVLATFEWRARLHTDQRARLITWATACVLLAVMLAPQVPQLAGGVNDASNFQGNGGAASGGPSIFSWVTGITNPVLLPLALVGVLVTVRNRTHRGFLLCLVATAVLAVLTAVPGLRIVTFPWYSNWQRIAYNFSYFEAFFAAIAVVAWVRAMTRRLARHDTIRPLLGRAVAVSLVAFVLAAAVTPQARGYVTTAYRRSSLVGADQRAAFGWLRGHVPSSQRVLNQFDDGSGWMETLDGVHPLFATKLDSRPADPSTAWGDRWYLVTHAADLATDPRARAAQSEWKVGYAYVSTPVFDGHVPLLDVNALTRSGAWRVVWQRGSATILRASTL